MTPRFGIMEVPLQPFQNERCHPSMIPAKRTEFQLPKEIKGIFSELKIMNHLAAAGISKNLGFTGSYVFLWIFTLLFQHKNLFQLLESKKAESLPGKDVMYRFLNHTRFNWRRFLILLSSDTVKRVLVQEINKHQQHVS